MSFIIKITMKYLNKKLSTYNYYYYYKVGTMLSPDLYHL